MAIRYWVNGSGNWNDTSHWSTASGGAGGASVPGASDNAYLEDNGTTTTVVTLVANTTVTTFRLYANVTFTTANFNFTCGAFQGAEGAAKAVNFGSSLITCNNIELGETTIVNAGTSTIHLNSTSNSSIIVRGNKTLYNVTTASNVTILSIGSDSGFPDDGVPALNTTTFNNVTFTPTVTSRLQFTGNIIVNGTLTYTGSSPVSARGRMLNSAYVQVTCTANAISMANIDFEGIIAGGGTWSGSSFGNGGWNSNITFTAPVTYYWVGNGGNFSDPNHWSTTSGGASGSLRPIAHDPIIFDSNSFTTGGQTMFFDIRYVGDVDFSGVTNTPSFDLQQGSNYFTGHVTLSPNVTWNDAFGRLVFTGDRSVNFTTNGEPPPAVWIEKKGGASVTLQDNWVLGGTGDFGDLILSTGVFYANNKDVSVDYITFTGFDGDDFYLYMGSGNWVVDNQWWFDFEYSPWYIYVSAGTSNLRFNENSWNLLYLKAPDAPDLTLYDVTWGPLSEGGEINLNNGTTLNANSLTIDLDPTYAFPWFGINDSARITVNTFTAHGTAAHLLEFTSFDAFSPIGTTIITADTFSVSYLDVYGMYAKGSIPVDATNWCVDSGLNVNWFFGSNYLSQNNVAVVSGTRYRLSFNLSKTPETNVVVSQGTNTIITV